MIGSYASLIKDLHGAEGSEDDPVLGAFRHELRRGCLTLAVMAALRTEHHGYGLRKALASGGIDIEQGTLYPLLKRLESQGLLSSEWRWENKRRKRFYRLTADGRLLLERLWDEWRQIDLVLLGLWRRPRVAAA